jgi:uncharacterized protein YqeY
MRKLSGCSPPRGHRRRRELDKADLERILDAEISDLRENADRYEALGRPDEAGRLRVQAELIMPYRLAPDEA